MQWYANVPYVYYHWVDTSVDGMLAPAGINKSKACTSAFIFGYSYISRVDVLFSLV